MIQQLYSFIYSREIKMFSSVQSLSCVQLFATPWTAGHQAFLSITNSRSLLKLMSIDSVMPSNHLILCHPLLLLPSIFPSIRVFSNESALPIRWPKYWRFSFNISPSKEHPRLISFRMDWLDLLAVQGTLKSLLQHHSSKPSIFQYSDFFIVQFSHPYMTTGKTMKVKKESEKVGLKLNLHKTKIVDLVPSLHGKSMGKKWKQWEIIFCGAPKSLHLGIAAMKLKDSYSLEGKLWPT